MRMSIAICWLIPILVAPLFQLSSDAQEQEVNEVNIYMYSLPIKGVVQRGDDVQIRVEVWKVNDGDDKKALEPLIRLPIKPRGYSTAEPYITGGKVTFDIAPEEFRNRLDENVALTFVFFSRKTGSGGGEAKVQEVKGAVIHRNGKVDLHVVVPNPGPPTVDGLSSNAQLCQCNNCRPQFVAQQRRGCGLLHHRRR